MVKTARVLLHYDDWIMLVNQLGQSVVIGLEERINVYFSRDGEQI